MSAADKNLYVSMFWKRAVAALSAANICWAQKVRENSKNSLKFAKPVACLLLLLFRDID